MIDHRLNAIQLQDSLHSYRNKHGMGTAIIEAKLMQHLSYLELHPFYGVILDLRKAFHAMDRHQCLVILEGYGARPRMIWLIRAFWRNAIMVCHVAGNYGTAFTAGCGVTQGGPLYAKLFNILVDTVIHKWIQLLEDDGDYKEGNLAALTSTFFTIFYIDNAYLASRDAGFL